MKFNSCVYSYKCLITFSFFTITVTLQDQGNLTIKCFAIHERKEFKIGTLLYNTENLDYTTWTGYITNTYVFLKGVV